MSDGWRLRGTYPRLLGWEGEGVGVGFGGVGGGVAVTIHGTHE